MKKNIFIYCLLGMLIASSCSKGELENSSQINTNTTLKTSGSATIQVFPVRSRHNTGYDAGTDCAVSSWNCGRAYSNSDFTAGNHLGIDIWADEGAPVAATVGGTIVLTGWSDYSGNKVTVRTATGWSHFFCHLKSIAPGISNGVTVAPGRIIGYVGKTGTASNSVVHLHYSLYPDENYDAGINPWSLLYAAELNVCSSAFSTVADFNFDGKTDYSLFANGSWKVYGMADASWGEPNDIPVPADYNGDGKIERAIFRPSTRFWWVEGVTAGEWGRLGDIPVPADYDGNGTTDYAVWRPSNRTWYVLSQTTVEWGESTDIPVPGDYNGDGKAEFAIYRPSTRFWWVKDVTAGEWGRLGDIPVPGDYDGNGTTDYAVWRPSNGTWYVLSQTTVQWGEPNDIPAPGDYNGDGKTDFAVWRPSNNTFYVKDIYTITMGATGYMPVALPWHIRKFFYP